MDLDYYEYILTYNTEKHQNLINKYFNRIRNTEHEFNNLIFEAYDNVRKVFVNFYDLQIIMYMYYLSYAVELYMNQYYNKAKPAELDCLLKSFKFDTKKDVIQLAEILPSLISKYTDNVTKTINMRHLYNEESLNQIIKHIHTLVKTYANKCLH